MKQWKLNRIFCKYVCRYIICVVVVFLTACDFDFENNDIKNTKQKEYVAPTPVKWTSDTGIKVIYYKDNELPLVRASLYIRGSVEKSDNPLALEAMGTLLKTGGTKNYPSEKLDLKLEKLSAGLSSSWGSEYGDISFSSLSEDAEELFKIVSDMVFNPSFDSKELELWKLKKIDSIKRRLDSSSNIAKLKYKKILYKTSKYGYISSIKDVQKLTRNDLLKEKEKFIVPDDVYLTIVGPITKKKIDRMLNEYFASWKAKREKLKNIKNKNENNVNDASFFESQKRYNYVPRAKEIYFMKKDDLNQATVYIVSKGPKRDEKKHLKYAVFSEYLGTGGFTSILLKDLRTSKGLVYSTFGGVFPNYPYGSFVIFIETGDDKLTNALKSTEGILTSLKDEKNISKETLKEIKNAMINSEIFKTSSLDALLERSFTLDFWGFSSNYDKLYRKNIDKFNKSDIVKIATKYANLADSFIVIVASNKALENLKELLKDNETIFSKYNLNICDVSKNGLCEGNF